MKKETVNEKFERAAKEYAMFGCRSVLVGFSGGADSSVLLRLMKEKCEKSGIKLFAAHVNHGIRGEEALRDKEFCRSVCEKENIPFFSCDKDVPALAEKSGEGLEECARKIRYDFFAEIMENRSIDALATAHNADDNLETVLFYMFRGCGANGLGGIPPVRSFDGTRKIIRPLIYASKEEILNFAKKSGIDFVTDSTNTDTDYTRNYIRAEIVPRLKKICPSPEDAISKLCPAIRYDNDFIENSAKEIIEKEQITNSASVNLLKSLPRAVCVRVLFHMCRNNSAEQVHINALTELVQKAVPHSRISLPENMTALIEDEKLIILKDTEYSEKYADKKCFKYDIVMGSNDIPEIGAVAFVSGKLDETQAEKSKNIYKKFIYAALSFDKIKGQLYVRNRLDGDKYTFGKISRKVKKLFCDAKIPLEERDKLPVFCDNDGIVWIPGFPPRDDVKAETNTNSTLYIYIKASKT